MILGTDSPGSPAIVIPALLHRLRLQSPKKLPRRSQNVAVSNCTEILTCPRDSIIDQDDSLPSHWRMLFEIGPQLLWIRTIFRPDSLVAPQKSPCKPGKLCRSIEQIWFLVMIIM